MKRRLPEQNDNAMPYDDGYEAVSMSECTGLIPSAPFTDSEVRSYADIYDVPLPRISNERRETMNDKKNKNKNQNGTQYSDKKDQPAQDNRDNADNNGSYNG